MPSPAQQRSRKKAPPVRRFCLYTKLVIIAKVTTTGYLVRHFFLSAFIDAIRDGSLLRSGRPNVVAGLTVGIVGLPLSMGLAIASGVPPQHGLYTAIVGGFVIAITGGSRVNISGPTAAFVVILLPVVQAYGLGGLLVSGVLAGAILVGLGFLKVGRFIQTIPYPVVVGFTPGWFSPPSCSSGV
jgi:SulP family sulfate permease